MSGILIIPQMLILLLVFFPAGMKALLAYRWAMPVLAGAALVLSALLVWLAFFASKAMRTRVHDPRFEAVLSSRWVRWAEQSKALHEELADGEPVQEVLMLYTTRLFPVFNRQVWVMSNRRILIFALGTGDQGKLLACAQRGQIAANIESARGWFWWTDALGKIALRLADGRVFEGYPNSPVTASRMKDLLAIRQGGPHAIAPPAPVSSAVVTPDKRRSLSPAVAFFMSLLLPGSAQLMQNRFVLGLVLLTIMLVHVAFVLTPVLLGWIGHFYDVPIHSALFPVLFALVWAVLSAWDAWNYAHGLRPARQ
jgi:hypothetical protein